MPEQPKLLPDIVALLAEFEDSIRRQENGHGGFYAAGERELVEDARKAIISAWNRRPSPAEGGGEDSSAAAARSHSTQVPMKSRNRRSSP